jgi:Flp pilus assembly protein TadB
MTGQAGSQRTTALIVLAFGVVACIIGIVFIATNHDLRATASFIVGVAGLAAGFFWLRRKPNTQ